MSRGTHGDEQRRQDRQTAIAWAAATLSDQTVVFIDTETTGLDGGAEIVDIALIDTAGNVLIESLVRPNGRIPPDAVRIHRITDAMVASAPRWNVVYPEVQRLIKGRTSFIRMLQQAMTPERESAHATPPTSCAPSFTQATSSTTASSSTPKRSSSMARPEPAVRFPSSLRISTSLRAPTSDSGRGCSSFRWASSTNSTSRPPTSAPAGRS